MHPGEQPSIIEEEVWQKVQTILQQNARTGGAPLRNRYGAILKGLIRCSACNCAMSPSHTTKRNKRYRYYTCGNAHRHGWDSCPNKSVPAEEIEQLVVNQIRTIGQDPTLLQATLAQTREQHQSRIQELEVERRQLERDLEMWHSQMRTLSGQVKLDDSGEAIRQLSELQGLIGRAEQRLFKVREHLHKHRQDILSENEITESLRAFDQLWQSLNTNEQTRVLHLLIEQITFDGFGGKVQITFHPTGIRSLTEELEAKERIA